MTPSTLLSHVFDTITKHHHNTHVTLVPTGVGTPWRLPEQFLSMSPILKVDSPLKEWFAVHLQPHVHYIPVRYDVSLCTPRLPGTDCVTCWWTEMGAATVVTTKGGWHLFVLRVD
jgi:hypothetical protein